MEGNGGEDRACLGKHTYNPACSSCSRRKKNREPRTSSHRRLLSFSTATIKGDEAFLYQKAQSRNRSLAFLLSPMSIHNCELRIQIAKLTVLSGFHRLLFPPGQVVQGAPGFLCYAALLCKNPASLLSFLQGASLFSPWLLSVFTSQSTFPASSSLRANMSLCYHSDLPAQIWIYNGKATTLP